MLILPFRTILLYLLVMTTIRIMGKHQIGQLQPFELVITIMISELAAIPMQDTEIPLLNGVIPIVTLLFIQTSLSLIALKSHRARRLICGNASILIANGHLNEAEMSRLRYSLTDLLEQLRLKDIANIADVEFAILETSGKLSVILKSQKRPVNPEDLHLETAYEGLPLTLILDGKIQRHNLQKSRLSEEWLRTQLRNLGFGSYEEVLIANQDTSGKLFIQSKKCYSEGKIL
jgi:uncharacterized membrane protein YcaP (DUF421 family)